MYIKYRFNKDKLFFTSDNHFHHNSIIGYCKRPFDDIDAMDSSMIEQWNQIVAKDDDIIIAGDFIFSGNTEVVSKTINSLNGVKWLVYGNHDYRNKHGRKVIVDMFDGRCFDSMNIKVIDASLSDGYAKFYINHYPCEYWEGGTMHLHGHVHSGPLSNASEKCKFHPMKYDVGVDNNNYKPISYEDLKIVITKQQLNDKTIRNV